MVINTNKAEHAQNRSGAVDAVRVFGIIAVVAGHIWSNDLIRQGLFSWHVPIFFFLSGYLWTTGRSLGTIAHRRAQTLLVPYVSWLVLISVPYLAFRGLTGDLGWKTTLSLFFGGSYLGRPFSAFWFVTALFTALIVYLFVERLPLKWKLAFLIGTLILAYAIGPLLARIPLSIGVAIPCIAFIMAGQALRHVRAQIQHNLVVGIGCLVFGFTPVVWGPVASLDLKVGSFGTPFVSFACASLISTGLILLAETLCVRLSKTLNSVFTTLAMGGFMVVLTHAALIWVLGDESVFAFLVALLLPWTVALIVGRTPFAPVLLGSKRRHKLVSGNIATSPPQSTRP